MLLQELSTYRTFIRNAFLSMLAYRLRYYTGIITYLLFVSVHYFIWKAIFYDKSPGEKINGFTLEEMVTYVAIGWIARSLYFSSIDEDIDEYVRTGQVSVYLLRPVNFHLMMLSQAFGETLFRFIFFTLPIGIVILLSFPVSAPAGVLNLILFSVSTIASFVVMAEVNFMVGLLAFVVKSTQGIMRAKYYLLQLFSGLLLPLTFFPDFMQKIIAVLPFKIITYVPLQFYLGQIPESQVIYVLAEVLAWILVLVLVSNILWKQAVSKLTLQGG